MIRIGIDVGGTNTDAVLMDAERVVASMKVATTSDIGKGIQVALERLLAHTSIQAGRVQAVMIGTTQFLNAVIEGRRLQPTAVIRLGLPATASLPPLVDWPRSLTDCIRAQIHLCHGGNEYDGSIISQLDPREIRRCAEAIHAAGIRSVAVTSVFATVNAEMELRVAALLTTELPEIGISLSHQIGRVGLLERENATVLNASLCDLATTVVDGFRSATHAVGIAAPIFVSQNDGTLMSLDVAERFPVATFASGPTNSMRGASLLSGVEDCIVVDVGGTTTDVGVLVGSFPREASTAVAIRGVRTNFRMPDVFSIGLGGGTEVATEPVLRLGPGSVGADLVTKARVFGGDVLTATDIAVAGGRAQLGDRAAVRNLDVALVQRCLQQIDESLEDAIDRVRISGPNTPVVLVGGGSILVGDVLGGAKFFRPSHFDVANAVGAAIAQVGGEIERVVSMEGSLRRPAIEKAEADAIEKATAAGARPASIRIVEVEEVALPYVPGHASRLRVKAVGDLAI